MTELILTCNAGSANTKLAAFDGQTLAHVAHTVSHDVAETSAWLRSHSNVAAVGHRVVHGGRDFTQPTPLTDVVLTILQTYVPLAPLHQPAALRLIDEARSLYPHAPHIACFDTAFHHTMPEIERRLPLPRHFHDEGVMRYGFHGISYEHIASALPGIAGELATGRVVVAHLGGGSTACAMRNMQSVATTTGFSTLDGMMMSTRCGALDPGVILYLLAEEKMPAADISNLLYEESGLKGVSGLSGDMQVLLASDLPAAREAVELYCSLTAKQIASLLPALGGMDALVFTGGIGEHIAQVRDRITGLLRWIGDFPVYVIADDEEQVIAKACQSFGNNPS